MPKIACFHWYISKRTVRQARCTAHCDIWRQSWKERDWLFPRLEQWDTRLMSTTSRISELVYRFVSPFRYSELFLIAHVNTPSYQRLHSNMNAYGEAHTFLSTTNNKQTKPVLRRAGILLKYIVSRTTLSLFDLLLPNRHHQHGCKVGLYKETSTLWLPKMQRWRWWNTKRSRGM